MKVLVGYAMLVLAGTAIAADAPKAQAPAAAPPATATVQLAMQGKVNPQGLALWDITNNAMDETGEITGKKIKAENWQQLLVIGKALEQGGHELATAGKIISAPHGAKLADEAPGTANATDVQRYIDADVATFRSRAARLEQTGASAIAAAQKKDVKLLSELANNLDGVCEDCHKQFWYPAKK
jgi:hypothetical protein